MTEKLPVKGAHCSLAYGGRVCNCFVTLFQLSLFFDVLLALCVDMTEDRFIQRGRVSASLSAGGDAADISLVRSARRLVWRQLKGFCMKARLFFCSLFYFL